VNPLFNLFGKKRQAVLVLPSKLFDESEIHAIEKSFKKHGIKTRCASSTAIGIISGLHEGKIKPAMRYTEISLVDTDALVFIGGVGALDICNDFNLHKVIQNANRAGKILAAIDYAPLILAHAEILRDRKVTVLETEVHKVEAAGAHNTGAAVEVDGNLITCKSASYVKDFADITARIICQAAAAQPQAKTA
jgi:protease I